MKKAIIIALSVIGILMICVPLVLAVIGTADTNIIGGADWSTFQYYFFRENGGLYFLISCAGAACVAAGAIVNIVKK